MLLSPQHQQQMPAGQAGQAYMAEHITVTPALTCCGSNTKLLLCLSAILHAAIHAARHCPHTLNTLEHNPKIKELGEAALITCIMVRMQSP